MISPARLAAFHVLMVVSAGRADLPSALARSRSSLKDERDRALALDIATGVQRWRARLDHLIVQVSKRPMEKLDPEIVEILRLGAYQLLHLTRVPAAAVVDDAVNLAKRVGKRSASGLVNAVLRGVSRRRHSLPLPAKPADGANRDAALEYFSITLSHPRWLSARWYDRFGFDRAEAWLRFNNETAPLTIRANGIRISRDELATVLAAHDVVARPGRFAPEALLIESGNPLREKDLDAGLYVVQDEASQLIALLAGSPPGARVLDTCAAPGGKTTALAAAAPGSLIVSCDVRDRRIALLRRTVDATGAGNVRIVQADLGRSLPFQARFDCVLVDVPCSGLGTLRRDPDIRWRRREEDLAALASAQRVMLANAAAVVVPGGRLIYATCSSEPEENEQVAAAFLAASPGFAAVDASSVHPRLPASVVDDRGHLRTAPDRHGLEAFFGAVFERRV